MMQQVWEERLCNERRENIQQRLTAHEQKLYHLEKNASKLSELSVQMGEIIKYHREQLNRQEQRLSELEKKPMRYAELIRNTAVSAVVSGTVAYIISIIFK